MLLIRNVQVRALQKEMLRRFEDRLIEHGIRYFPEIAGRLGDDLREAVRHTERRARNYGFDTQREVCKYLNLQCLFGRNFDRDPACAWALDLLNTSLPGPPKMERLYALALDRESEGRGYFAITGGASE